MERKEAKAKGLPFYETGIPCKYGHIAPRHTSSGVCVECQKVHRRNYANTHKAAANENMCKWREKNPDYNKAWRAANPDKVKAARDRWNAKNPNYIRDWQADNPSKVREYGARASAPKADVPLWTCRGPVYTACLALLRGCHPDDAKHYIERRTDASFLRAAGDWLGVMRLKGETVSTYRRRLLAALRRKGK